MKDNFKKIILERQEWILKINHINRELFIENQAI